MSNAQFITQAAGRATASRAVVNLAVGIVFLVAGALSSRAASFVLGTGELTEGPAGGSDSVVLGVAPADAPWTATANDSWLHLSSAQQTGVGSANVVFSFDPNSGPTRIGTLSLGDQTLTVTQAGARYVAAGTLTTLVSKGLNLPLALAVDAAGNIFFSDSGHNAIKEWTAASQTVSTVVGSGINYPEGVAVDRYDQVAFADYLDNAIKLWSDNGQPVATLASGLHAPTYVAMDLAANVYFVDSAAGAIKEWPWDNYRVKTLVKGVLEPRGLAVDAAGNVYFADYLNNEIEEWTAASGTVSTVISGLNGPTGVAVDGSGNLYWSDFTTAIKKWTAATHTIRTLVASGLSDQAGLAVDAVGNVYFADWGNAAIKELPRAFVDPSPKTVAMYAHSESLPMVFPASENLLPPFAPTSDQPWLTIDGVANGVVKFSLAANNFLDSRTAHIGLLGQTITVTQAAATCSLAVNTLAEGPAAGSDSVGLTVSPSTANWTAMANDSWLHLAAGSQSGTGKATVSFTYDGNPGAARAGSLTIGGQTLTVNQGAATFSLAVNTLAEGPAAGKDSVVVTTVPNIALWTATANDPWLHLSPANQSGTGSGTVTFTFDGNAGPSRTGTITIAGRTLTVTQGPPTYSLAVSTLTESPAAGNDTVGLTTVPNTAPWTATANAPWLHLAVGSRSGAGSASVRFNFDGNPGAPRTGTLTIAGQTLTVNQGAATYVLGVSALSEGPAGGKDSVVLKVSANAPWTATANAPWLHLSPANQSGTGSATVTFTYDANLGDARTGTLTIAGQTLTVNQEVAPFTVALGVSALSEAPAGGSDSVVLAVVPLNAPWTATANDSWLHLNPPNQKGVGSAAVVFSFDPNSGPTRVGTLSIGGQTLTVTQAGSSYVEAGTLTTLASQGSISPNFLAVDAEGNAYFSDTYNSMIMKWTAASQTFSTLVSSGLAGPTGVAVDGAGNVYFSDYLNNAIKKWTATDQTVNTLVGSGLDGPVGVAVDGAGNVYFADFNNNAIKKWTAASQSVSTLVGSGLYGPASVAVDGAGNVYFVDSYNNAIKKWSAASQTDSILVGSGLSNPASLAVDGGGNVYFADIGNNTIKKWTAANQTVSTVVASGFPSGVAVDRAENLYFTDWGNKVIKELPRAFVDASAWMVSAAAGADSLPVVLPAGENLLAPFAPTSDQPWLAISGAANGVVSFSFAANNSLASRTAHIGLLGQTITLTQGGATYSLAVSTLAEGPAAGSDSVVLTTVPDTATWTAKANNPWLHLSPPNRKGVGSATVSFSFDDNPGAARAGTLTIAGQILTVNQGPATYSLAVSTLAEGPAAGSDSVVLTTVPDTAPWAAKANAPWLHLAAGSHSGTGSATVSLSFDGNPGASRTGTLTIAGQTLTVNQGAATYSLAVSTLAEGSAAGSDSVGLITVPDTAPWTATANNSWLHLSPPNRKGTGSATVSFSFDGNPGASRTGTLTIGGQTLTVTQAAATYSLAVSTLAEGPAAGSDSVVLTTVPDTAPWTATANAPWLHLAAGNQSGTGSATVNFSFDGNPGAARTGTLTIGGQTLTVNQGPATFSLAVSMLAEGPAAGSDSVGLTTVPDTAPWTATANTPWLHLAAGSQSGTGSATVSFSFDANSGAARTGTLTIGGQTLTVNQAAATYSLAVSTLAEGPAAGSENVGLTTVPDTAPWTAKANNPWLHLSPANQKGTGSATVSFLYDDNPGASRTGTLTIGGQTLTVNQGAAIFALGASALTEGPAAGSDSVVLAAVPATAPWTAAANDPWLHLSPPQQKGAGNATVVFSFDPNSGPTRVGTLSIGGQILTVAQAGASYVGAGTLTTLVSAGLDTPHFLALDAAGNVYIADSANNAIKKWTAASQTVSTLVDSGLNAPLGVAVDGAGNVYIADYTNNAIKKWTAASQSVSTLVDSGLNGPTGVAVDGAGNVYFSDFGSGAIKEWRAASQTVSTLVRGVPQPRGVAVDAAGNVYFAVSGKNEIDEWTAASQTVTTLASRLNLPRGVAVDGAGNVYFADSGNGSIKKWTAANRTVTTLLGSGLIIPAGVAVDAVGNVYFADLNNNAIKELPRAFVDPSARMESAAAGADTLPVVLPASENLLAPFAPTSDQLWLTISGVADGQVSFAFAASDSLASRTAHIHLLGQTIAVTQSASTSVHYSLNPDALLEGPAAGSDSVGLTTVPATAPWTATANASWLHLAAGSQSGTGSGTVSFSFDGNPGAARTGTLTIAGQTLTVNQGPATFALGASALTEGPAAGSDSVGLTTVPDTAPWTATANASWLHLAAGSQSGTGSGTVSFSFDGNPGAARTGTLTIAGQTLTVNQGPATFALGASALTEGTAAGSDSVGLTTVPDTAPWTATANASWLHLAAGSQSGTGSGTVSFSFDGNPGAARTGTLTIAGQTLTVNQAAATFTLGTSGLLEGPAAGGDHVVLTAVPSTANWTATANDTWLHLAAGSQSGVGNATVVFTCDANPGDTRVGTLTVGDQTLTVTQAGAAYVAAAPVATLVSSGLGQPTDLALDGAGNIYISDYGSAIRKWTTANQTLTTLVAGSGSLYPAGVAVDGAGNVYFGDISPGSVVSEWRASDHTTIPLVANAGAYPEKLALDAQGNLFISYDGLGAVYVRRASDSTTVPLVAGLAVPEGLAADLAGNLYIAEYSIGAIKEWRASDQTVTTLVASGLNGPGGVALDGAGNLYIADTYNNAIKKWTAADQTVTTVISSGLNLPWGVALDGAGNVYIADAGNAAIKVMPRSFIDPTPKTESAAAGNDTLPVILAATAGLMPALNPVSDQPWLTIDSVANGVVSFSFTGNDTAISRTAHITLFGQSIAVTQPAGATASLSTPTASETPAPGSDSVVLTMVPDTAPWTATANDPWLHLAAGSDSGTGSATVRFNFDANLGATRTGTLTIAGLTLTVTQGAATYSLAVSTLPEGPAAGSDSVVLTAVPDTAPWTATANDAWLHLASGNQSGFGSATVTFGFDANLGAARTGTLTIAGQTLTVTQGASTSVHYSLNPDALLESPAAGGGSVVLTVVPDTANWTATANDTWLHLAAGSQSGVGNATVVFTCDANPGDTRVGTLTVGDQTLTVTQAGAAYVAAAPVATLVSSGLGQPTDLALDGAGNIYISDYGSAIRKWTTANQTLTTLVAASGSVDPAGVAVDGAGNVYFGDISPSGVVSEWRASDHTTISLVANAGAYPEKLALDALGNLFISYDGLGAVYERRASNGTTVPLVSGLAIPEGLAADLAGNLYIAEYGIGAIKEWRASDQTVTTLVASGLNGPGGVALDGAGNLYIADTYNNAIKKWTAADQTVTTVISSGLNLPWGVALDGAGNVYIADAGNAAIKVMPRSFIDPTPKTESAAAGNDTLPVILAATAGLMPALNPVSDQPWLTIDSVANGVVGFSFTANDTASSRTAHITLFGQSIAVMQAGAP